MIFCETGILRYQEDDGYRLTVEVDEELSRYYRAFIPRSCLARRPIWPAHITVVRVGKETPTKLLSWGKYEGTVVSFAYDSYVRSGKGYFWLNVWCDWLRLVREDLGLAGTSKWTHPPAGDHKEFHLTVGNQKGWKSDGRRS